MKISSYDARFTHYFPYFPSPSLGPKKKGGAAPSTHFERQTSRSYFI
jgi:hypothetical protein